MRLYPRPCFRLPKWLSGTALLSTMVFGALLAAAMILAPNRPADAAVPTLGQRALTVATHQTGKPYVWGAAGPRAFDCSGLTQYAYARVGRRLPHNALAQYQSTHHIPISQLRPGDLVFMNFSGGGPAGISHVGIYAGHGNWIVARKPGTPIGLQRIWTWRGVFASRP